jgi:hypothetical protein
MMVVPGVGVVELPSLVWHEADKDVGGRNDGLSRLWREEEEACKGEKERSSRWCYCSLRWDGLEKKVGSLLFTAVLRWCG